MAFEKVQQGNHVFFKIKGLTADEKEHYFEINGEKSDSNCFEGNLVEIENSSYEYQGKTKETIKFKFVDGFKIYVLDIAWNGIAKTIINSLASQESFGKIRLSLYVNKKGFKSVGVNNNGKKCDWKHSYEETTNLVEYMKNKEGNVVSIDDTELIKLYKQDIALIKSKLSGLGDAEKLIKEQEEKQQIKNIESDLPFN